MIKKLLKNIGKFVPVILIIGIEYLLFKANYISDTWLIGWDSTNPELNFQGHLLRDLTSVWQEYRGLGVLDGMAHSANLVHLIYLWLLNLIFPANMLRYVFTIIMHGVGGIGTYYLIKKILLGKNYFASILISFLGAIFYMFNPGTIQMFYAPLELFVIHFGFLPWLILSLINYLQVKSKKNLLIFMGVNILALSQAHVPTIFIVYCIAVFVILAVNWVTKNINYKHILVVLSVIFTVNAFWGLPYVYSAIKNSNQITNAKINQLSNEEIVLRNRAYGDLKSTALLYGFNFDYEDLITETDFDYQFLVWREFWLEGKYEAIGLIIFILSVLGLITAFLKRNSTLFSLGLVFVFSFINLASNTYFISEVNDLIRKIIPYYEAIFRFAFTKFIIIYALCISVFFTYFIYWFVSFLKKYIQWIVVFALTIVGTILILVSVKPVFYGNFFYDKLKIKIPQEYFDTFEFFSDKNNAGRIMLLPQSTMWSWEFNTWGYRGSGFIWQGMNNPILHRSFDPWNSNNETYYLELASAMSPWDEEKINNIIQKYAVEWIVVDENIYQPGGWMEALKLTEINKMLDEKYQLSSASGKIRIYRIENNVDNFVFTDNQFALASHPGSFLRYDNLFQNYSNHIDSKNIFYPFSNLLSDRKQNFIYEADNLIIEEEIPEESEKINIPAYFALEKNVPMKMYAQAINGYINFRFEASYPLIYLDEKLVSDKFEEEFKVKIYNSVPESYFININGKNFILEKGNWEYLGSMVLPYDQEFQIFVYEADKFQEYNLTDLYKKTELRECWKREDGEPNIERELLNEGVKMENIDAAACSGVNLPFSIEKKMLGMASMTYASSTLTPPTTCMWESETQGCAGDLAYDLFGASKTDKLISLKFMLTPGRNYFLDLSARGSDKKGEFSEVEYKDILFKTYRWVGEERVRIIGGFTPGQKSVDVGEAKKIKAVINLGDDRSFVRSENWINTRGYINPKNCDLFGRGIVEKDINPDKVEYHAFGKAINCDYINLTDFEESLGYVLRFVGENKEGRSLKFVLNNNLTRRNELEYLLDKKVFDNSFVIFPFTGEEPTYDLNLETRSFGEDSVNILDRIETFPITINWLTMINLSANEKNLESNLKINNVKKTGTYRYDVEVQGNDGIIALAQGYESGWAAYRLNDQCLMVNDYCLLPFLFGKKLEHVKYNGWGNAWLLQQPQVDSEQETNSVDSEQWTVDSETTDHRPPATSHRIVIVYWPQYLQFAGYGILAVGATAIFCKSMCKRKWGERVMK